MVVLGSRRLWVWLGRDCWPPEGCWEDRTHGPGVAPRRVEAVGAEGEKGRGSLWTVTGGVHCYEMLEQPDTDHFFPIWCFYFLNLL